MMGVLQLLGTLLFFCLVAAAPPGAVVKVDSNNHEVQACADFAVQSFNDFNKDPHLYVITKFFSAMMANIGGGEYTMEVELRKTKCLKESKADPSSCRSQVDPEAKAVHCKFIVLSAPWRHERDLIQSSCTPQ